tara:strand:+ start:7153 stop:8067 length:915 start_codon:yes stop_codon:yes gene_type:complete
MATFSGYNVFLNGTVVASNPHNENWDDIAAFVNALADGTGIDAGAIVNALLATNAVATTNIQDLAVTTGKLGANAVTAGKIANDTITNTQINANADIALSKLGVLTGYVSNAGVVAATDSILEAIEKLNGNDATNANLTGMVTSVGNATTVVTNANLTGGVTSVGNAATVVTNANLTGPITSVGNATTITDKAVTGIKMFKKVANFSGSYTVATDDYILNHTGGSTGTLTLPNATTYAGRSLQIRNTTPQVIVSATNNIVSLQSAGTPRQVFGLNLILTATDGSWCELVADGTNWLIVNASELT